MTDYPVWFNDYFFSNLLNHLKGKPDLKFLQIGTYTGDASLWLLENVLTDDSSQLTDVDTWEGSDEPAHKTMDFGDIYQYYLERTKEYHYKNNQLVIQRMTSDRYFETSKDTGDFDFIYIDGDHHAMQVYKDAVNAWERLKPNGILAFDDYTWEIDHNPLNSPRYGIDKFLVEYADRYELMARGFQVWILKK